MITGGGGGGVLIYQYKFPFFFYQLIFITNIDGFFIVIIINFFHLSFRCVLSLYREYLIERGKKKNRTDLIQPFLSAANIYFNQNASSVLQLPPIDFIDKTN